MSTVGLVAIVACGASEDGGTAAESGSPSSFAELFAGYSADYEVAATPDVLSGWSDLVVQGTIRRIEPGRLFGASEEDPVATRTIVMVVDVASTFNGKLPAGAQEAVYVELSAPGGAGAEVFDKYAPKSHEVVLYLVAAPTATETPIVDPDAGRPAGQPLFQPTSPQGFLIGDASSVLQPLDFAEFTGSSLQQFIPESEQFPVDPAAESED